MQCTSREDYFVPAHRVETEHGGWLLPSRCPELTFSVLRDFAGFWRRKHLLLRRSSNKQSLVGQGPRVPGCLGEAKYKRSCEGRMNADLRRPMAVSLSIGENGSGLKRWFHVV